MNDFAMRRVDMTIKNLWQTKSHLQILFSILHQNCSTARNFWVTLLDSASKVDRRQNSQYDGWSRSEEFYSYSSQYRIFGISPHVFQEFFFIFATVGNLQEVRPLGQLELASQYPSWSWYSQTVKFHVPNKLGKCNFVSARMADARKGHQIPPYQRK